MNKKLKFFWYLVGIGALVLFLLMLISSVIQVGEKLNRIHVSAEWLFYVLVIFFTYITLINPIRLIVTSPSFSIATSLDDDSKKVRKIYKKVAKNIVKNNDLSEESEKLLTNYKGFLDLKYNLEVVFDKEVKKQLNKIIIKNAKTVMISTAISQSARLDMITVFAINLKMIKELVLKCGFRPSMVNLSKLSVNVMSTALIAEGLENLNIDDILPQSTTNMLAEIPFIKPILSSVTQGISNALLTIRIGMVTRKYLFKDGNCITKEDIRRQALKESLKLLPIVVSEGLSFFPKRVVKLFSKKKETSEEV